MCARENVNIRYVMSYIVRLKQLIIRNFGKNKMLKKAAKRVNVLRRD